MYRKGLINMQENKRNSQIKKRSIKCTEHKEAFQFSNFSICLRKTINKMFSLSTPHPPQKKKERERKEKKNKVKPLNGVSSAKFSILGLILNLSPLQLQYALPKYEKDTADKTARNQFMIH
jgi:hypothetical protein